MARKINAVKYMVHQILYRVYVAYYYVDLAFIY